MVVTNPSDNIQVLTRKDFVSDEEVRWCPGCGDYSILAQTQRVMPDLGIPRENIVFISGIGCSSRLPYYMNTYGFHSIHGRAPTIATGLKSSRPELSVWVVTGDGDALSIGGNHILHVLRRNVDLQIILHNNEIYGLTKGQYSPTSPLSKVTYSSPMGSIDWPLRPLAVALGAEATFVARSLDVDPHHMVEMLKRAADHRGTSFVEIYQNCNIYNDGAFEEFTAKEVRADRMLFLKHGEPMIFGKNADKGIVLRGLKPEVVELGKNGATEADILVHDETLADPTIAFLLSRMDYPDYPVPVGVLRAVSRPTYNDLLEQQIATAISTQGEGDINALFRQGDVWEVE
ncbi:MAG TPA: 2-oxoacid:ferredoxin oxidoreductase subunit beta [Dehalococcoidia bacterium]|nr:2-oxoacid:ferredoxin oxidoreductase subunit beta [Dehalococcoidia bacterium]